MGRPHAALSSGHLPHSSIGARVRMGVDGNTATTEAHGLGEDHLRSMRVISTSIMKRWCERHGH